MKKKFCEKCHVRAELLIDAVMAIETIVGGLERYRRNLPAYERLLLEKTVVGVPKALVLLKRIAKEST